MLGGAAVPPGVTRIKVRHIGRLCIRPAAFVSPQGTGFSASLTISQDEAGVQQLREAVWTDGCYALR